MWMPFQGVSHQTISRLSKSRSLRLYFATFVQPSIVPVLGHWVDYVPQEYAALGLYKHGSRLQHLQCTRIALSMQFLGVLRSTNRTGWNGGGRGRNPGAVCALRPRTLIAIHYFDHNNGETTTPAVFQRRQTDVSLRNASYNLFVCRTSSLIVTLPPPPTSPTLF